MSAVSDALRENGGRFPAAQLPLSWTLRASRRFVSNNPQVSAGLNGVFAQPNLVGVIRPRSAYSTQFIENRCSACRFLGVRFDVSTVKRGDLN